MPKDQNKCQKCGNDLKIKSYGMLFENDLYLCPFCGNEHESNVSTWIDIDGTEHEDML